MNEEHNKTGKQVIDDHFAFFARNGSGCAFAAMAARNPTLYEWQAVVLSANDVGSLNDVLGNAVANDEVTTLSVIFPDVDSDARLDELLTKFAGPHVFLHERFDTVNNGCFRFRAKVGAGEAYISGFGPFDYMPITRQTPHTSIVTRVGPRPDYDWYLKEPEEGLVHVADMDMKGVSDKSLKRMWNNSFIRTAGLLGKKPDEESAAKTTFVIPQVRADQISARFAA